jgi:cytochrome c553
MHDRKHRLGLVAALLALGLAGCQPSKPQGSARGPALFQTCASCHGTEGQGRPEYGAPAIAGLDEWYVRAQLDKFRSGARGAHADDAAGLRMRPMARQLDGEAEVQAVAEYVAHLPETNPAATITGDATQGATLFATCATCHGAGARGDEAKGAPPLHAASDWYLYAQLEKFRAGIRGTNPADTTGAQMRPMALGLADEASMRDVLAYIATLPD